MSTLTEQLAAVDAKVASLLPTEEVQLTAPELFAAVAKELKGPVSKERGDYLREVVAKTNFEGSNTFVSIPILNDPLRVKEGTASIASIGTLASSAPSGSNWSYNGTATTAQKAQLISKLLGQPDKIPAFIEKSALTDKIGDIKKVFGLTDDDLKEEYDLRWKVGDLISSLQNAIKLERMVGASLTKNAGGTEETEPKEPGTEDEEKKGEPPVGDPPPPVDPAGEPPVKQTAAGDMVWPGDMAAAQFDPVQKSYKKPETMWGTDPAPVSRR